MKIFRPNALLLGAIAAVAMAAPRAASAQILYNNGVPDGQNGFAVNSGESIGDNFILGSSAVLGSFQWYDLSNGTNSGSTISADYSWRIYNDASGSPGSLLASGNVVGGSGTATGQFCCAGNNSTTDYFFNQAVTPLPLSAGTYWLVLGDYNDGKAGSGFWAESGEGPAVISVDGDATFIPLGADLAFSVSGTVTGSVTPEPATMTLLATGLVAMVGVGARRRKKNS